MPNQPTIISILLVTLSVLSMFIYPNTIYYTLNLLFIVFIVLNFLFFSGFMSSLVVLMLLIVYVGAIIILIGYVCAVCPNVDLSPRLGLIPFSLFVLLGFFAFLPSRFVSSPNSFSFILDFLYSLDGVMMFSLLVFMLFITLLVVTSYYVSPNGPFRSLF